MSKKTPSDYLRDILRELDDIENFTSEGKAVFMTDVKTRKAVIRSYEIIGEIAKRLPDELIEADFGVDWRRLIGFGDFLTHQDEEVIVENVWDAVEDLPDLRTNVG